MDDEQGGTMYIPLHQEMEYAYTIFCDMPQGAPPDFRAILQDWLADNAFEPDAKRILEAYDAHLITVVVDTRENRAPLMLLIAGAMRYNAIPQEIRDAIGASEHAICIEGACLPGEHGPLAMCGLAAVRAFAARFGGTVFDEVSKIVMSDESLARPMEPGLAPNCTELLSVTAWRFQDGLFRLQTEGMHKFALPDLMISNVAPNIRRELHGPLLVAAQALIDRLESFATRIFEENGVPPEALEVEEEIRLRPVAPPLDANPAAAMLELLQIDDDDAGNDDDEDEDGDDDGEEEIDPSAPFRDAIRNLFGSADDDEPGADDDADEDDDDDESEAEGLAIRLLPTGEFEGAEWDWQQAMCRRMGIDAPTPVHPGSISLAAMEQASLRARREIPEIRELFAKGLPDGQRLGIKVAFPVGEDGNEYMWLMVNEWNGTRLSCILESTPMNRPDLTQGQLMAIHEDDIFDYVIGGPGLGVIRGGYTQMVARERGSEL